MLGVSVIIVNWNGKEDTLVCLDSLGKFKIQNSKFKVFVIDNGSEDDSVIAIRKKHPEVKIIEAGENLGFAGGNNIGIRKAIEGGADFVWLLNNDTVVDRNALVYLVDAFKNPVAGVAGSKIYFSPGREFHRERYKKSELGKVLWYAGGIIDWKNMYASHRGVDEVDHGQFDKAEETPFITGCSMMVKKEVFERIGFLDEKFFAYLEDLDFCLRARRAGYKLLYVPQSIIWHKNAGSSAVGSEIHQYYMTRNRSLVGLRYAPIRTKIALLREGLGFIINGPRIRRKAVLGFLRSLLARQGETL